MVAAKPTWRKEQVWDHIRKHHHLVVEADNEAFDSHYANLLRQTSWVLKAFTASMLPSSILSYNIYLIILFFSLFHAEEYTPPKKKKMTPDEVATQCSLHNIKQNAMAKLVTRGRAAIEQIRGREMMASSAREAPADEERAAARKAAEAQKHARQVREEKRQQMVHFSLHSF
jgi:hypothetical protein